MMRMQIQREHPMKQYRIDRRRFLAGLAGSGATARLGAAALLGLTGSVACAQRDAATGNGTRLVLLGTQGGPNFRPARKECSSAVVVDGQIYLFDCGYGTLGRLGETDRSLLPAQMWIGRDIEATSMPTEAFTDDRVVISSVENTHFPDSARQQVPYRALSYRLDSSSRSITISGDTAYSENLVRLAEGTDVFVCEVIEPQTTRENFERRVAAGAYAENPEGVWKHIIETHSTTEDAGRMAAEAGAGMLVLTHILPGAMMAVPDERYLEGIRRHYDGEVVIGEDLMVI
jgi:ribonuclease BN (tRNA processing enzyme)